MYLEAPVEHVTGFDVPMPVLSMEDYHIPHPLRIAAAIKDIVEY
jgi:pyruvate dehydrogenase E1 component beta subunit